MRVLPCIKPLHLTVCSTRLILIFLIYPVNPNVSIQKRKTELFRITENKGAGKESIRMNCLFFYTLPMVLLVFVLI